MARVGNKELIIDGDSLRLSGLIAVARRSSAKGPKVILSASAKKRIQRSFQFTKHLLKTGEPIYGVNTGFGLLSDVKIPENRLSELQVNLLRSHAAGTGNPLSIDIIRAALLLRANALAKGASGCSLALVEAVLALLNKGVTPWVPEQGSVGASGDLAPLAHMSLVLIGEGKAYYKGKLMSGAQALKAAKIKPIKLLPKEGLSLINGTQIMTAIAGIVLHDAIELMRLADIAGAMSLEAFQGTRTAFHKKIQDVRPHKGQADVAKNLLRLTNKSEIGENHRDCDRIQDPYSFRCMPQVHGASRYIIEQALPIVETEFNSSTDNPLVFPDKNSTEKGSILSGGNFHGQYVAMIMDCVAIALSEFANISDQRMQKLINPVMSNLPAFLTKDPGLNSGMMIVQVAAASIVSENKILSHPASVDSIPTSADKEDHVSMGVTAARKARKILRNVQRVLSMEFLCASQGLEFSLPLKPGAGVETAYKVIRKQVNPIGRDRAFHIDIEKIFDLMQSGHILRAVEQEIGPLT